MFEPLIVFSIELQLMFRYAYKNSDFSINFQEKVNKILSSKTAQYMENGKLSKMRVNNNVFSSVLGYFEQTPFMGLPCRLTSYTQKYFKYYNP
jgi:hypothetical protein